MLLNEDMKLKFMSCDLVSDFHAISYLFVESINFRKPESASTKLSRFILIFSEFCR
jgi:hypothetical protein